MSYRQAPTGNTAVDAELRKLSNVLQAAVFDAITLVEHNAAPDKTFDGMTVLADGTNWNPGSGQGVYTYYNSTWNKLG